VINNSWSDLNSLSVPSANIYIMWDVSNVTTVPNNFSFFEQKSNRNHLKHFHPLSATWNFWFQNITSSQRSRHLTKAQETTSKKKKRHKKPLLSDVIASSSRLWLFMNKVETIALLRRQLFLLFSVSTERLFSLLGL
jgi:hypothetical protein